MLKLHHIEVFSWFSRLSNCRLNCSKSKYCGEFNFRAGTILQLSQNQCLSVLIRISVQLKYRFESRFLNRVRRTQSRRNGFERLATLDLLGSKDKTSAHRKISNWLIIFQVRMHFAYDLQTKNLLICHSLAQLCLFQTRVSSSHVWLSTCFTSWTVIFLRLRFFSLGINLLISFLCFSC